MIEVIGVSKTFGAGEAQVTALHDVDLEVAPNSFVTLIGPSGCGKTTLLRVIAGLVRPSGGIVRVHGSEVTGPSADRAMVFQTFALLPWATVKANIAFGLTLRGESRAVKESEAMRLAELVGLRGFENARPNELSGGMQQRVGLARALAVNPSVLLMDEPFGSLDEQTKRVMQDVLLDIWERERTTVVFVTHSIDEAIFLADRLVVMSPRPGRIAHIVDVPLERPRKRELETSPEFVELRAQLWQELLATQQSQAEVGDHAD
jgi:ABC-type nitrate/sulfonate/bicarbonate transport system ATPase subunit